MKKILIVFAILAFIPTYSFAEYKTGPVTLGSGTNALNISTSNSVRLDYGQNNNGETFVVSTYHERGNRTYVSSSEDANIYWGSGTGVALPTAPTAGTSLGETTSFGNTL